MSPEKSWDSVGSPSPKSRELHSQASSPPWQQKACQELAKNQRSCSWIKAWSQHEPFPWVLCLTFLPHRFTGLAPSISWWMKMVPAFPHTDQKLLCRKSTYQDSFVWLLRGDVTVIHCIKRTGTKPAVTKSTGGNSSKQLLVSRAKSQAYPKSTHERCQALGGASVEQPPTAGCPSVGLGEDTGKTPRKRLPRSTGAALHGCTSGVPAPSFLLGIKGMSCSAENPHTAPLMGTARTK